MHHAVVCNQLWLQQIILQPPRYLDHRLFTKNNPLVPCLVMGERTGGPMPFPFTPNFKLEKFPPRFG